MGFRQQSSTQEQLTMDQHGDKTGSDEEEDIVIEEEDGDKNDKGGKSKDVIILSPTNFDSANMPRSVRSSAMINAKTTAQSLRVKIIRSLGKCDDQVALLKEIEQLMSGSEQPNSDHEEEFCDVQTELISSFDKVKGWNEDHNTTCFDLQKMCNFISESESTSESQNVKDARAISEKNVNDEKVTKWRREKWLRKRK